MKSEIYFFYTSPEKEVHMCEAGELTVCLLLQNLGQRVREWVPILKSIRVLWLLLRTHIVQQFVSLTSKYSNMIVTSIFSFPQPKARQFLISPQSRLLLSVYNDLV